MSEQPARSLALLGASNFRDLGGYGTQDAHRVRWRTLFRSDHLAALTPRDAGVLASLGIKRTFDFRGVNERAAASYQLPGVTQHLLPIEPTVVQGMQSILDAGATITARDTAELMRVTYRNFVHDNGPRFAELFAHLLRSDEPLVFHCTAGKDRTGYAAALILLALGVPQRTVMQDYLLTNDHYRMPVARDNRVPREALEVLWRVQGDFLEAALEVVERDFGGIEPYFAHEMKLGPAERERLRQVYLRVPES